MGVSGRGLPLDPHIRLQLFLDDSVEFVRRLGPLEIRRLLVSLSRVGGLSRDETYALLFHKEMREYERKRAHFLSVRESFKLAAEYISLREATRAY